MSLFNHHTKAPREATTTAEAHNSEVTEASVGASINKDPTEGKSTQLFESNNTASVGNKDIATSGAPMGDGLVHEKGTEQKQKHHFLGEEA